MAVDDYVLRETAAQVAELCLSASHPELIAAYLRQRPYLELVRQDLAALAAPIPESASRIGAAPPMTKPDWNEARAANSERFDRQREPVRR
jgi:hypothetical protein